MRHGGGGDLLFLVLIVVILVRTSHAVAGEEVSISVGPSKPDFAAGLAGREPLSLTTPLFDLPKTYQAPGLAAGELSSPGDFRPRGPSLIDREPRLAADDAPMLHGTSVWQRLADYRSQGRVRLLTLWEAGGSSVSLQAGKKGEPSLQWTSRSMNRGGATRGVFDPLVSMAGANRSSHPAPRPSQSEAAPRLSKPSDVGMGANK